MSELMLISGAARHDALVDESLGRGADDPSAVRALLDTAWGRRHCRVAALRADDGSLLASVLLHDLAYRLDFERLRIAGIGTPFVRESRRRRGLDRFFLKAVHDRLRQDGFDGAVCFAAPQARWPERAGYEPLPFATLVADLREFRTTEPVGPSSSRVRPFRQRDFPAVRNLYNTLTCVQRLAVLRDDDHWRHELERARLAREGSPHPLPHDFLVGEREGRVVSYLRAARSRRGGSLVVLEYGFEVGAREDVTAILRHLLAGLGDDAPSLLRSVVPSRLANLVPARRLIWRRHSRPRMFMRSFGRFEVPTDAPPDERLVWESDWLWPAGPAGRINA